MHLFLSQWSAEIHRKKLISVASNDFNVSIYEACGMNQSVACPISYRTGISKSFGGPDKAGEHMRVHESLLRTAATTGLCDAQWKGALLTSDDIKALRSATGGTSLWKLGQKVNTLYDSKFVMHTIMKFTLLYRQVKRVRNEGVLKKLRCKSPLYIYLYSFQFEWLLALKCQAFVCVLCRAWLCMTAKIPGPTVH